MLSVVRCTSLIGTRSSDFNCPIVRCVSGSKLRIDSSVSPKKSSRTGNAIPGAKRSIIPPRTAYSPVSRTVGLRWKPLCSSHAAKAVVSTRLPGAAANVSSAILFRSGTRCKSPFAVKMTTRGRASLEVERASLARTVILRASIAELGDTRS